MEMDLVADEAIKYFGLPQVSLTLAMQINQSRRHPFPGTDNARYQQTSAFAGRTEDGVDMVRHDDPGKQSVFMAIAGVQQIAKDSSTSGVSEQTGSMTRVLISGNASPEELAAPLNGSLSRQFAVPGTQHLPGKGIR